MPFVDLAAHPITSTAYGRWQALRRPSKNGSTRLPLKVVDW
jgi:hypothetical protein